MIVMKYVLTTQVREYRLGNSEFNPSGRPFLCLKCGHRTYTPYIIPGWSGYVCPFCLAKN